MIVKRLSTSPNHRGQLALVAVPLIIIFWICATQYQSIDPYYTTPTHTSDAVATAPETSTSSYQAETSLAPSSKPFPKKHWQVYKSWIDFTQDRSSSVGRTSVADLLDATQSWRKLNPEHRYELLWDSNDASFFRDIFPDKSGIVDTFTAVQDGIIKADMLRYLILYAYGGVYSDLDTRALKPVSSWIPEEYEGKAGFVLGIEIDEPGIMWADWADNFVFCQSTVMSKPNHGILAYLIENVVNNLKQQAEAQNTDIAGLKFLLGDVLKATGPVAFSKAVFSYLSDQTGEEITRANFTGLHSPKLVADVLVMPTVAFVPGQPHSNSGTTEDAGALVQHLGMGSWVASHPIEAEKDETKDAEATEDGH